MTQHETVTQAEVDGKIAAQNHPTIVRKTADKTLNNVAVLENDNHLFMAIDANEVWQIDIFILCEGNEDADIQFGLSCPGGCTIFWGCVGAGGNISTNTWGESDSAKTPALLVQVQSLTLGIQAPNLGLTGYRLSLIVINGVLAGNVNLQWAQAVATVGDTTVKQHSCLIAHQLA